MPGRGGRCGARPRHVFAIGAAASTFLALRAAPMGFDRPRRRPRGARQRGRRQERRLPRPRPLRRLLAAGTLVQSPGGYVPPEVKARRQKPWQQGQGVDFDTVSPHKLDQYRYAITTDAPFQSTPPPNFRRVGRRGRLRAVEAGGEDADRSGSSRRGRRPGQDRERERLMRHQMRDAERDRDGPAEAGHRGARSAGRSRCPSTPPRPRRRP